jgi:predicted DNA-binding transcriptional regulator AlpA
MRFRGQSAMWITGASGEERSVTTAVARRHLTIADLCADLGIARSTFYDWRAKGRAPKCIKLPNGDLRIRRSEYERWLDDHEDGARR